MFLQFLIAILRLLSQMSEPYPEAPCWKEDGWMICA